MVLKDTLAFIPEVGAVIDIGIDAITKFIPQAFFIFEDAMELSRVASILEKSPIKKNITQDHIDYANNIINKHSDLINERQQAIMDRQTSGGHRTRKYNYKKHYNVKKTKSKIKSKTKSKTKSKK